MLIETGNLFTVANFGLLKGISRQHIYRLLQSGLLNVVTIDGVTFVINDELAASLERRRRQKTKQI